MSIALRTATAGAVGGIEEPALRALVKMEQAMPARLRQQVDESLRLRGLRLMKSSAKVRPYLGEYFLLDLRDRAVQRTNVDLLGLSRELGLETNHLSLGNEPEVNCDILLHTPTEVLG